LRQQAAMPGYGKQPRQIAAVLLRQQQQVGIIQSLIVTCRLHGIDVYTYLVDVLQRVSIHSAKDVIDLTPRVWKTKFSHAPMKSDIARADQ
jgi:hypothetical protein